MDVGALAGSGAARVSMVYRGTVPARLRARFELSDGIKDDAGGAAALGRLSFAVLALLLGLRSAHRAARTGPQRR